ncbi:hypothetical protein L6164_001259 [Bauhinia variegata]|uniref:Uncharacterized protein n=1 Tax=Bauhinia variegata TaxID=167791 RepID=A0ACB9Q9J1_BAUVA|nr:hypothetical protein L6164_001259 [Bauhinia variegata]
MTVEHWSKPGTPYVKMNVDASRGDNDAGGLGGVLQDATGSFIAVLALQSDGYQPAATLEALSIREGQKLLKAWGFHHVVMASDAQEIIRKLQTEGINFTHEGLC